MASSCNEIALAVKKLDRGESEGFADWVFMSYLCQRATILSWGLCMALHLSQLTSCKKLVRACLFGRRNDGTYSQDLITDLASGTEICH